MKKQAIVLIHGVGEQVPMDTLRSFITAVWNSDPTVAHPYVSPKIWSKPDKISGDFELRRMTTTKNREGRKTDFFEMYWAHLMKETKVSHLIAWVRVLLLRRPWRVPSQLRPIWWMLVALVSLAILVGLNFAFKWVLVPHWVLKVGSAAWLVLGSFLTGILLNVAGDAARYLHVAPPNIEIRRSIRQAGIDLLEKLHLSGQYDRIILVGHSLGSVIGYDILTHLWPRFNDSSVRQVGLPTTALEELEILARKSLNETIDVDEFQPAQSRYLTELRAYENKWLITDFVTLGSPLAHAPFLMARTQSEFKQKTQQREFPTCPPMLEEISTHPSVARKFTYEELQHTWVPHHAAVFAPTRWTNLYFPCRATFFGDLIGGPLGPMFGPGIRDMPIETDLRFGLLSHTLYWTFPKKTRPVVPPWIGALQGAVRLCENSPANTIPGAMQV